MKTCRKCHIEKPLSDYYISNRNKDKRTSYCKPCANTYNKELNKTEKAKNTSRSNLLKRRYGISQEIYEQMLAKQNNACAICKEPCKIKDRLAIDHCHTTGKIRGLLCFNCNLALGKLKDSAVILQAALDYIVSS